MPQSLLAPEFCLELHQILRYWIHERKSEVVSKTQCQTPKTFDIVCWNNTLEFRYQYTIYKSTKNTFLSRTLNAANLRLTLSGLASGLRLATGKLGSVSFLGSRDDDR